MKSIFERPIKFSFALILLAANIISRNKLF